MNLIELNRSLRQLRLGGMAAVLETRLQQAQAEPMAPIDFLSCLVADELTRPVRANARYGCTFDFNTLIWTFRYPGLAPTLGFSFTVYLLRAQ